ncbi:MAG: 3-hydroxybutyrate dehydrogenase [Rhizobiales bacterium NRL2]|jgi:3-hydroxybutyrate dehydrogenase|nr:MAG: 3-hydroxybutyrate dehydrogenase [Rhizobiales bacterium NRL2]
MTRPQNVIVTGSTSGIGLGTAHSFARAGARVVLNGRRLNDAAEAVLSEFRERYGHDNVIFAACDVADPGQVEEMVSGTVDAFGSVDVLVQNAGIQHTSSVHEFPLDKWDQIIAVDLSSVFYGIRAALPRMLAQDFGRIINVASVHGLVASKEKAAYVAAKHGVVGLTKVTALETATVNITCNAICPGWVLTPLVEKQIHARAQANGTSFDEEKRKLVAEKQPSQEFATPEQIGALAVFLASEAAAQITGQALPVDGGWTAQ